MLQFTTIRNVHSFPTKNYAPYIRPLTHLDTMIWGYPAVELGLPSEEDLGKLEKLVDSEVNGVSTGEPYIDRLFHHFAANVEFIDINLSIHALADFVIVYVKGIEDRSVHGFKHWRSLWFRDIDDDESLDICFFLRVFKNLKTLTVSRWFEFGWMQSIAIHLQFMESIISAVELMNGNDLLTSFEELIVIDPDLTDSKFENLDEMATHYNQTVFKGSGWGMKPFAYRGSDLPSWGECDRALSFCKKH